jgi:hypothetical protein
MRLPQNGRLRSDVVACWRREVPLQRLRLQNVVLELIVIDATQRPTQGDLRGHLQWIASTSDGENLLSAQEIDTAIQNVLDGKCILVSLIPSWGAQICALAQSVDWR